MKDNQVKIKNIIENKNNVNLKNNCYKENKLTDNNQKNIHIRNIHNNQNPNIGGNTNNNPHYSKEKNIENYNKNEICHDYKKENQNIGKKNKKGNNDEACKCILF